MIVHMTGSHKAIITRKRMIAIKYKEKLKGVGGIIGRKQARDRRIGVPLHKAATFPRPARAAYSGRSGTASEKWGD